MALTQDDVKRLASRFDGAAVLGTNLKELVLKGHLEDCVGKIQTKLKRTRKGKVIVFWGETK